ncbi:hypothetical protein [Cupriavidus pauculus]|uniref:hypothetical protein n=1 Tax=Cupriavidus pauculus TaxID=82633 RepID=UPI001D0CD662|nr:hypothetical protein [Cupriavidus pauculus]
MTAQRQVARWRRTPRQRGLAGVIQKRGYQLRIGDRVLISVAYASTLGAGGRGGWYWAGMGQNTGNQLLKTAEEAKVAADAWYKANKGGQGNA